MDLLILLVERRGQLVTRAEIVDLLWGKDVFVEVDTAVHTAVRKVRQALHDSPDNPAFIETVPAKGYRFAAPVDIVGEAVPSASELTSAEPLPVVEPDRRFRRPLLPAGVFFIAVALAIAIASATFAGWLWLRPGVPSSEVMLAVLPFANLTGDPGRDYLADGLGEEIIASLGQINPERVLVVGRTSMLSYKGTTKSLVQIGKEVGADYLVEGSIRAEDLRLRITAKLIRASDQSQVGPSPSTTSCRASWLSSVS
jgi:TolB-like protein/DNA-binding winged helix-turn-helix (wHTH) protein